MKNYICFFILTLGLSANEKIILAANLDQTSKTLNRIYDLDHKDRNTLSEVEAKYGQNSVEHKKHWQKIHETDASNLKLVNAIVDKYGWLGPSEIGLKANMALFLVVQHAELKDQQRYLPIAREAVKLNKIQAGHLALLEDRVAMRTGKPQVYGSQLTSVNGQGLKVYKVIDPDNLDKRRIRIGLKPMKEYLKHWNMKWDLKKYKEDNP